MVPWVGSGKRKKIYWKINYEIQIKSGTSWIVIYQCWFLNFDKQAMATWDDNISRIWNTESWLSLQIFCRSKNYFKIRKCIKNNNKSSLHMEYKKFNVFLLCIVSPQKKEDTHQCYTNHFLSSYFLMSKLLWTSKKMTDPAYGSSTSWKWPHMIERLLGCSCDLEFPFLPVSVEHRLQNLKTHFISRYCVRLIESLQSVIIVKSRIFFSRINE